MKQQTPHMNRIDETVFWPVNREYIHAQADLYCIIQCVFMDLFLLLGQPKASLHDGEQ